MPQKLESIEITRLPKMPNILSKFLVIQRFEKKIQWSLLESLEKLQIELPDANNQFRNNACKGTMIFMEEYGVSVKIKPRVNKEHYLDSFIRRRAMA